MGRAVRKAGGTADPPPPPRTTCHSHRLRVCGVTGWRWWCQLFMEALNRRHFQERQSASLPATLLAAAAEAGLDVPNATAFL